MSQRFDVEDPLMHTIAVALDVKFQLLYKIIYIDVMQNKCLRQGEAASTTAGIFATEMLSHLIKGKRFLVEIP